VLVDLRAPRDARGDGGGLLVRGPVRVPERAAQRTPVVVADRYHAPLVVAGARIDAPWGGVTTGVPSGLDGPWSQRLLDEQLADLHQDGLGLRGTLRRGRVAAG